MNKQIAISAKHLKKAFGKGAGAGKSTLMYSLSSMDKPDGGEIYFGGADITKLNNDKAGYVSAERMWTSKI